MLTVMQKAPTSMSDTAKEQMNLLFGVLRNAFVVTTAVMTSAFPNTVTTARMIFTVIETISSVPRYDSVDMLEVLLVTLSYSR